MYDDNDLKFIPAVKPCCTCKKVLSLGFFYKDKGQKDGYEHRCKECRKKSARKTFKTYQKRYTEKQREWRQNNRPLSRIVERRSYRKLFSEDPGRYREKVRYRQKIVRIATPPWVDRAALREIYRTCPYGHHVDHIIPLTHPDVCGLHVPWNLRHYPGHLNSSKNNKLPGEEKRKIVNKPQEKKRT